MRSGALLTSSLLVVLPLAACALDAREADTSEPCDLNPESSLAPQAVGGRPGGWDANGVDLNGVNLNAGYLNAGYLNGVQVNGTQVNGVQMNGTNLNGSNLNGDNLNGLSLNGVELGARLAVNELVQRDVAGRIVASGSAFVGARVPATLSDGSTITLTITAFERESDIARYKLAFDGRGLCEDDGFGMFVPGVWDVTGARLDSKTNGGKRIDASFSCAKGALAKCVEWGYAPWHVSADVHQACTRMVRADYCGSGVPHTKDGTAIDVGDSIGVQTFTGDPSFQFEAAWGPNGAVCVARTRFDSRGPEGVVLPSCWEALPRCASAGEASASGAKLMNMSRQQTRRICSDR